MLCDYSSDVGVYGILFYFSALASVSYMGMVVYKFVTSNEAKVKLKGCVLLLCFAQVQYCF